MRVLLILSFFFCGFFTYGQGFKYTDMSDVKRVNVPYNDLGNLLRLKQLKHDKNVKYCYELKDWLRELVAQIEDQTWKDKFLKFDKELTFMLEWDLSDASTDLIKLQYEIKGTISDYNAWVEKENERIQREEYQRRVALELEKEQERLKAEAERLNSANEKPEVYFRLTQKTSLRAYPDSQSRVILRFDPEDKVLLVEEFNEWWTKVEFKGKVGYVKKKLLK